MAWQNEMVRILRHLINDLDSSSYTDDRLEEVLIVAAQLMIHKTNFDNTYTLDVDTLTLTPDPTELSTKDDDFINLICMKGACIILTGEVKTLAAQGYRVTDGPSSIDIKGAFDATKQLRDQICQDLEMALVAFQAGNSKAGQAILSPYTQTNLGTGSDYTFY